MRKSFIFFKWFGIVSVFISIIGFILGEIESAVKLSIYSILLIVIGIFGIKGSKEIEKYK
jgi:hypothetical protein